MLILGVHHCCGNIPFFNLYDLFILLLTFFLSFLSSDKKGVEIKRGSGVKEENIPLLSPFSLFSHYFCSPNAFREYFALLHHTLFVLSFLVVLVQCIFSRSFPRNFVYTTYWRKYGQSTVMTVNKNGFFVVTISIYTLTYAFLRGSYMHTCRWVVSEYVGRFYIYIYIIYIYVYCIV